MGIIRGILRHLEASKRSGEQEALPLRPHQVRCSRCPVEEGRHDMAMKDDWAACAFPMHGACSSHIFLLSHPTAKRR